ncbi:NUDIX domain, putative [Metarhizium acridum CQMa 102]|uniref:NUDIX domain, putative n=1 Tax=Metarhizium acridum (strain CQMa 102) TaxID=655827 RepID=E9ECS6_METAQ|nr:NUDIX domain, putative [Metarhizium acridum CQMa 102]EFY86293.1 NUDIX domain, putative [Metarhizium acridum CQMa 102]
MCFNKPFEPARLALSGNELRALHDKQASRILVEDGKRREMKDKKTADLTKYEVHPDFKHTRTGVSTLVVNPKTGFIIVGPRMGSHGAGTLAVPGGHLDTGENHGQTSEREFQEETKLGIKDVGSIAQSYDNFAHHSKGIRCYDTNQRLGFQLNPDAQPETREKNKSAGYDPVHPNLVVAVKLCAEPALFPALSNLLDECGVAKLFLNLKKHGGLPLDDLIQGDGSLKDQHKIVSALHGALSWMQKKLKEQQKQFDQAHWEPLQWSVSEIGYGLQEAEKHLSVMQRRQRRHRRQRRQRR